MVWFPSNHRNKYIKVFSNKSDLIVYEYDDDDEKGEDNPDVHLQMGTVVDCKLTN